MDQEKDKLPALPSLRYPRAALVLLSLAQLLIALDATIVFVALDSMGQHLQLPAHHLQWVISGYSVAFGGCLLLGGRCADLLGQRRMYIAAMALFGLASLAGGFATDAWLLIAARAAQGVGAALLFPATLAMINILYRPGAERNRALGRGGTATPPGRGAGGVGGGGVQPPPFPRAWGGPLPPGPPPPAPPPPGPPPRGGGGGGPPPPPPGAWRLGPCWAAC